MTYQKPEILTSESAFRAVCSNGIEKPTGSLADGMVRETVTAYEADE